MVRGIKPPVISVPDPTIDYPELDLPTEEDFRQQMQPPQEDQKPIETEPSRELADPQPPVAPAPPTDTAPDTPPATPPTTEVGEQPTLSVPGMEIPIPSTEVIQATAAVAAVSTASALAATTALKPLFEWLFKLFKAVMKQAVEKVKKKFAKEKPEDSSPGSDSTH